jgi:hypothetical protein
MFLSMLKQKNVDSYNISETAAYLPYTKQIDMAKTFTLPKDLQTANTALTGHEPCELLYQTQLVNFLSEEFEGASFTLEKSIVDSVLAYSKAVEVKDSSTMVDGHQIMMN